MGLGACYTYRIMFDLHRDPEHAFISHIDTKWNLEGGHVSMGKKLGSLNLVGRDFISSWRIYSTEDLKRVGRTVSYITRRSHP